MLYVYPNLCIYILYSYTHIQIIRQVLEEGRASFHRDIGSQSGVGVGGKRGSERSSEKGGDKGSVQPVPVQSVGQYYAMLIMFWWNLFMFIILMSFLISCITQFAQYHQVGWCTVLYCYYHTYNNIII